MSSTVNEGGRAATDRETPSADSPDIDAAVRPETSEEVETPEQPGAPEPLEIPDPHEIPDLFKPTKRSAVVEQPAVVDQSAVAEQSAAAPPAKPHGAKSLWRDAIPYEETGVLIRPAEWSTDRIETALINVGSLRGGPQDADNATQQPKRTGLMRFVPPPRRGILLGILLVQAALSLRNSNTAFEDEAFYIYSGHLELAHLVNGQSITDYASFSSGAPVLYPVLGAIIDQIGGLFLVRLFSLLVLLSSTGLVYLTTRRLLGVRAALCGAALFASTPAVIFMGGLATYDAAAVFLLALAAWIVVRTAGSPWPYYVFAVFPMVLAVGTKYAALLFVPTVIVLAGLSVLPYHGWRWALVRPVSLTLMVASMAYGALRLAGPSYLHGIQWTTTNRAPGTTPTSTLLIEAARWGAPVFAAALVGGYYYVFKPKYDSDAGLQPGRKGRGALALLMLGTALLAPADQIHLHTDVSFHKHIGFGLMFAAPLAGYGLVRLVGEHLARLQLGIGVWVVAIALGMSQSTELFGSWPDSTTLVAAIAQYQKPSAHYLVEIDEVPIYYLRGDTDAEPDQFTSTFSFQYTDKKGETLDGDSAYQTAVQEGYFQVIAFDNITTPEVDQAIMAGLSAAGSPYRKAASIPERTAYGVVTYQVWVKK